MVPQPTFVRQVNVHDEKRPIRSIVVRFYRNNLEGNHQKPTVLYVPGFMSHGKAVKSEYVSNFCSKKRLNFVCYDPEGLGESSGDHASLEFSDWFDDCQAAIQVATEENPDTGVVLVGSSMGAWISLKMVEQNRDVVKGLILIAPAINFMWSFYLNWYNQCDEESQRKLEAGESVTICTEYGDRVARKSFAMKSRIMELDTSKSIEVSCPVRILHGVEDDIIPFERSMKLMELLTSNDVDLIYRKRGGHRLAEQNDLKLLSQTLESLLEQL